MCQELLILEFEQPSSCTSINATSMRGEVVGEPSLAARLLTISTVSASAEVNTDMLAASDRDIASSDLGVALSDSG